MHAQKIPVLIGVVRPRNYAKGGLVQAAEKIRKAGRNGDTVVVHLSPDEFTALRMMWGNPTYNPKTGLPEYFKLSSIISAALPLIASVFAPGVGTAIGSALGAGSTWAPVLGNALMGAGVGALGGGGRGALIGGLTGGAASALAPVVSNALAGTGVGDFFGMKGGQPTVFGGMFGPGGDGAPAVGLNPSQADQDLASAQVGAPKFTVGGTGDAGMAAGTQITPPGALAQVAASSAPTEAPAAESGGVGEWIKKNKLPLMLGGGALLLSGMGGSKPAQPQGIPQPYNTSNFTPANYSYSSTPIADDGKTDWYRYGTRSQSDAANPRFMRQQFTRAAAGGYMQGGGALNAAAHGPKAQGQVAGPGTGRSDEIPAQLSDGEYVMDAETVAMLGDGSTEAGARKLDAMRANLRKHKGRALSQGRISPDAKAPEKYMAGGRS